MNPLAELDEARSLLEAHRCAFLAEAVRDFGGESYAEPYAAAALADFERDVLQNRAMSTELLGRALDEEWCNGCLRPRAAWGPTCPGMTVGDSTHYHSPEFWRAKASRAREPEDVSPRRGTGS